MTQSLVQNWLHIVFSTKQRFPFLADQQLRGEMHAYLAEACRRQNSQAIQVGGVKDHVHILCRLSKNASIADLIKEIKRPSSSWVKTRRRDLDGFQWQSGCGILRQSLGPEKSAAIC